MGQKDDDDGVVHNHPVPAWDKNFVPPDYLYRIILVCIFFGLILFLIFFALFRYLRWQNKQRALLQAQEDREAGEFPVGIDERLECADDAEGDDIPLGISGEDPTKECTCSSQVEDTCVCQPLNPSGSSPLHQQQV